MLFDSVYHNTQSVLSWTVNGMLKMDFFLFTRCCLYHTFGGIMDSFMIQLAVSWLHRPNTQNLKRCFQQTPLKFINYYGSNSRSKCGTLGFYTLYIKFGYTREL